MGDLPDALSILTGNLKFLSSERLNIGLMDVQLSVHRGALALEERHLLSVFPNESQQPPFHPTAIHTFKKCIADFELGTGDKLMNKAHYLLLRQV